MADSKPRAATKASKSAKKTTRKSAATRGKATKLQTTTKGRRTTKSASSSGRTSTDPRAKKKAAKPKNKAVKAVKSPASPITVGRVAPLFNLESGSGESIALKNLRGKLVVLYFYPKDMTPGCTTEACDFRDRLPEIEEAGAVVLGVSPDSTQSHVKFATKHDLQFPLLADPEAVVAQKYGVWQEKSLYGRKFMGIVRTTFLIDREGKVARVWRNVKVSGHVDEVLESVRELASLPALT